MLVAKRTGKNADILLTEEHNNGSHGEGQIIQCLLCIILHKKKHLHVLIQLVRIEAVSSGCAVMDYIEKLNMVTFIDSPKGTERAVPP